ncbi:Hint domain-containing protein [Roseovarius sp. EL26]|uniref:Hint domain-containing protein n=1 Tax=Roseovarius sp. EL26 TaxID=2126672 RepID=UPI0013C490CA|nr:Hint domain-containing protein [Roseovarius sp. EL26]
MTMTPYTTNMPRNALAIKKRRDSLTDLKQQPERRSLLMRKYHSVYLSDDGEIRHSDQIAPALPLFESAFSAFARGTLIETENGQFAIEDLEPGMNVLCPGGKKSEIIWIGSMTIVPGAGPSGYKCSSLTRVMAHALGMNRPGHDLIFGPGARMLTRPTGVQEESKDNRLLTPVNDLSDGDNIISILPPRPVEVYHLCLSNHTLLSASGLEVESFHPGPRFESTLGGNMLSLFMSLFPHVDHPEDFGPLKIQRLPILSANGTEVA